jgi:excisionase family DNA binding protein
MVCVVKRTSRRGEKGKGGFWTKIGAAWLHKAAKGLDIEGAADVLGVSKTTIYKLAREGTIPASRVGREWRFSRTNLVDWVKNGTEADQLAQALKTGRVGKCR